MDWEPWCRTEGCSDEEERKIDDKWAVIASISNGKIIRLDLPRRPEIDINDEIIDWNARDTPAFQGEDWIDTDIIGDRATPTLKLTQHYLLSMTDFRRYCPYCSIGLHGYTGTEGGCQEPYEHGYPFLERIFTMAIDVVEKNEDTWYKRLVQLCELCRDNMYIFKDAIRSRDPRTYAQINATTWENAANTTPMIYRTNLRNEMQAIEDVCEQAVRSSLINHESFLVKCLHVYFRGDHQKSSNRRTEEEIASLTRGFLSKLYTR